MPATNELTYSSYLALDELIALQRLRSSPAHADELLFIVVHQSSELWFKVILHELDGLIAAFTACDPWAALTAITRVNALVRIVTAQLSALETLPPQRFAEFRGHLGSSSGSQSIQFRAIEAASGLRDAHFLTALEEHGPPPELISRALARPTLQALFEQMVAAHGLTLDALYGHPGATPLFLVAEQLLDYEQEFARWRFLHVQLVERIIGPSTGGTGGTLGSRYLQRTIGQRFFPNLWDVRTRLYAGRAAPGGS